MLNRFFSEGIPLGLAQAALATLLALAVMFLARWREIRLERETIVSLGRGIVQVVIVGSVLLLLFEAPLWTAMIVLPAMVVAAAAIARRRAASIPRVFWVSLAGIAFGSGIVIVLMTFLGVIAADLTDLIPVGSMLIANAMNTSGLALNRFRSEVVSHVGQIEAGLALGAPSEKMVRPYTQAAVTASLIPRLDSLRSLGIVWIPGMILSGTDPVYAAIYQFVVLAMIFAAAGLSSVATTVLVRRYIFSDAEQLLLRPAVETG
jgi:putative ABC transport system permease protein